MGTERAWRNRFTRPGEEATPSTEAKQRAVVFLDSPGRYAREGNVHLIGWS